MNSYCIPHRKEYPDARNRKSITTAPMVAVIGKDTAKLGFDVERPCASRRKIKLHVRVNSKDEIQPGDIPTIWKPLPDSAAEIEVTRIVDVACCPQCGKVVEEARKKVRSR